MMTCCGKNTKPEPDSWITISPQGGEYSFPDGISLRVPAGAVTENTNIMLKKVSSNQLKPIFIKRGIPINNLLVCIEGKPDSIKFIYPVQLGISVELEPGEFPFVHEIDLTSGHCTPAETEIICDPEQNSLIISCSHFSAVSVEILKEFQELFEGCEDNLCRCGRIKVEQHDKYYICQSGDCQVSETNVTVTFLDCPGTPVEESILREVSAECIPNLVLSAASTTVSVGGHTSITAQVYLGCEPIEGQSVDFSISGLASLNPTYTTTDASGEAHSTFSAGSEKGIATVIARSTISYYSYTIYASAAGQYETVNGPLITKELSQSLDIEVVEPEEERWTANLTYHISSLAGITFSEIGPDARYIMNFEFVVYPGTPIATILDIHGIGTASQEVTLTPYGGCHFENINVPPNLDIIIDGELYLGPGSRSTIDGEVPFSINSIQLDICNKDHPYFYTFDSCFPGIVDCYKCFSFEVMIGYYFDPTIIPLIEGVYSGEYQVLGEHHSYTITLRRKK